MDIITDKLSEWGLDIKYEPNDFSYFNEFKSNMNESLVHFKDFTKHYFLVVVKDPDLFYSKFRVQKEVIPPHLLHSCFIVFDDELQIVLYYTGMEFFNRETTVEKIIQEQLPFYRDSYKEFDIGALFNLPKAIDDLVPVLVEDINSSNDKELVLTNVEEPYNDFYNSFKEFINNDKLKKDV